MEIVSYFITLFNKKKLLQSKKKRDTKMIKKFFFKIVYIHIVILIFSCGGGDSSSEDVLTPTKSINVSQNEINFGSVLLNQTSQTFSISVQANNISSDVNFNTSNNFEVSSDNNNFSQSLSASISTSTIIYVRFTPTSLGNINGKLTISSSELSAVEVALQGVGENKYNYQAFSKQSLGFGGGFSQSAVKTFQLHDDLTNIEQIKMYLQIECPSTGCDDWDRFANVKVKDSETGNWYEIARYITPYWVGTELLERGLEFDVTDFKSLLNGTVELRIYIENWTAKADIVSIDFDYIVGTPDYQNYAITEILNLHSNSISGIPYGVEHNLDLEKSIQIPSGAEKIEFRSIISGWGHATPYDFGGRGCAEWCFRNHFIKIDSAQTFQHYMGSIGCASNPISNQNPGNWQPNRAGWCPGMAVPVRTDNLDISYSGKSITFEYELEDWTSDGAGGNAFYAVSTYIVLKSNNEISTAIVLN